MPINNQFVSCLYDLYHVPVGPDPDLNRLSLETRLKNIQWLLGCDIPLILYADPDLKQHLHTVPDNVTVIYLPLSEIKTYNNIMSQSVTLPVERNTKKDRQEYYALMNSKLDFIQMARQQVPAVHYTWIDCAIFKLFDPKEVAAQLLKQWSHKENSHLIVSPSGWDFVYPYLMTESPNWRFLGSILSIPDTLFEQFYTEFHRVLAEHLQQGSLTWEVNYWTEVSRQHPDWFLMYFGNGTTVGHHDISMLNRPDLGIQG